MVSFLQDFPSSYSAFLLLSEGDHFLRPGRQVGLTRTFSINVSEQQRLSCSSSFLDLWICGWMWTLFYPSLCNTSLGCLERKSDIKTSKLNNENRKQQRQLSKWCQLPNKFKTSQSFVVYMCFLVTWTKKWSWDHNSDAMLFDISFHLTDSAVRFIRQSYESYVK